MKTIISFGKHAVASKRRINLVEVHLRLDEKEEGKPVFTASAIAWNICHTDGALGGQCLDTLAERCKDLRHNPLYMEIVELWKRHHLNDMHAGTEKQEEEVHAWLEQTGKGYDYTEACEHLKSVGLYNDNGYEYGHSWLYRAIPDDDLKRIKKIMGA